MVSTSQPEVLWDDKHFLDPAYRVKNEELLERVVRVLPSNNAEQNLSQLMELSLTTRYQ